MLRVVLAGVEIGLARGRDDTSAVQRAQQRWNSAWGRATRALGTERFGELWQEYEKHVEVQTRLEQELDGVNGGLDLTP